MEKNINYLIELDEFLMKILRDGYVLKRSKSKDPQQLFNIQMFNKLRDDGYIEPDNFEWDKYQISFDGTLFIENGGYCGKAKMDGLKQKNQNRKDWLLITGTWVIGLGTVGLVIAELYNNHLITAIDNSLHSNQDTRFCSIICYYDEQGLLVRVLIIVDSSAYHNSIIEQSSEAEPSTGGLFSRDMHFVAGNALSRSLRYVRQPVYKSKRSNHYPRRKNYVEQENGRGGFSFSA